jgi:hypothetical protein
MLKMMTFGVVQGVMAGYLERCGEVVNKHARPDPILFLVVITVSRALDH